MSDIRERLQHWLEIDLDKLTANLQTVNGWLREQRPDAPPGLIAVVKNDAYGFGAVPCARAFAEAGADRKSVV